MTKATTVYIDNRLLQAAKLKAIQVHQSVSHLINDALRMALKEDAMDLEAIRKRKKEPTISFEAALKDLEKNGLL